MIFELRRGPQFELSGGLWPSRGEARVDPAKERGEASTNPDTRIHFPLPFGERVRVRGLA